MKTFMVCFAPEVLEMSYSDFSTFQLRREDMADLDFQEEPNVLTNRGYQKAKRYFVFQCERRAWEIYGGPPGLAAERRR